MWYVVQTATGQEQMVKKWIDRTGMAEDCFIPVRERKKKYEGEWHLEKEKLFPGYVFVVTDSPGVLMGRLNKIPRFTRFLGVTDAGFIALSEPEIRFISRFGDEHHVSAPSLVEIEAGNRVRIISGNLLDYEGEVVSYNLHKRIAVVAVPFMGETAKVYMGIDFVEKLDERKSRCAR